MSKKKTDKKIDDLVNEHKQGYNPLQYLYDIVRNNCPDKDNSVCLGVKMGSYFLDEYVPNNKQNPSRQYENEKEGLRYALSKFFDYLKGKKNG